MLVVSYLTSFELFMFSLKLKIISIFFLAAENAIENAAADSTVPESNESSQDATFEEDAVMKTESEVCEKQN